MKVLITGKSGFIAKNIIEYLSKKGYELFTVSHNDSIVILEKYCSSCDFVFHLAAVQRAENVDDFWQGNVEYTELLISLLKKNYNKAPIVFSSSIAIEQATVFAKTKLKAEQLLREYSLENNIPVYIFKLNHIFGVYGKPNFNNVIATFCNNLAHNIPITVSDPSRKLQFTYIDDLMIDFEKCLTDNLTNDYYLFPTKKYTYSLGEIIMMLGMIKNNERIDNEFYQDLYSTYLYYLTEKENIL